MANILVTGIATLDIINRVSHYPREDEELRADDQLIRRGGNASNTCSVLVQLGDSCQLAATLADDMSGAFIRDDIEHWGIAHDPRMIIADSTTPTSYITLNSQNGSRTIVHYRRLSELSVQQFDRLDLSAFDWFHFEARNSEHTLAMMQKAREQHRPISLEVEKPRPNLQALMAEANLIMFSRDFARSESFDSARQCLSHYAVHYPDAMLTCTWGDQGAYAWQQGKLQHSPAFPPPQMIDTIGAGDTFNAGLIHSFSRHQDCSRALSFACKLAGASCGFTGFQQLRGFHD